MTDFPTAEILDLCDACGHPADGHDRRGDDACSVDGCACGPLTGAAILAAIAAADPTLCAYIEHTGGGCQTVYVSHTRGPDGWPVAQPDAYGDPRYLAAIGPGWIGAADALFDPTDCYVGPDDDGQWFPPTVHTLATITAYFMPCADCGEPTGAHLSADECDAAGIDAGLRDGLGCAIHGNDGIGRVAR